jgi:hypothetical protein
MTSIVTAYAPGGLLASLLSRLCRPGMTVALAMAAVSDAPNVRLFSIYRAIARNMKLP